MNDTTMNAMVKGALVWSVPKPADAASLQAALQGIGLGDFAPNPETPEAALKHALQDYGASLEKRSGKTSDSKHKFKVEARFNASEDGFELLDITRRTGYNTYFCECCLRVDPATDIVEIVTGSVPLLEIQEAYDAYRKLATGSAVGRSLIDITQQMHGCCVKLGSGGNYYLPEDAVSQWEDVITAYESTGQTRVYRVRFVMDKIGAKAVRDGIVDELTKEAAQVAEDLRQGELREDVLERRKQRSLELRARAREYEDILQDTLIEVHAVLDMADACAAAAVVTQEAGTVFDTTFA
jgi:hypothetical protein